MELENIIKGAKVEILTKQRKLVSGTVEDVAPRPSESGKIVVRLVSGEIGKVQRILTPSLEKPETGFDKLLKKGENFFCEFKESALWSQNITEEEVQKSRSLEVHYYKKKASRIILAKSIAAFMNSEGGNLVIGIRENKSSNQPEILGIDGEFLKLKDKNQDGYKRMILDEIIKPFFPSKILDNLNKQLLIDFQVLNGKTLCWIRINKSSSRVFLTLEGKEVFMIRIESENKSLDGEKLVDYCIRHF